MKSLIDYLVKSIVDNPKDVNVSENETDFGYTNINVCVNQNDIGKIIGKNGKIIKALRLLLRVASIKEEKRANLVLNESPLNPRKRD